MNLGFVVLYLFMVCHGAKALIGVAGTYLLHLPLLLFVSIYRATGKGERALPIPQV